jgi:5-(aminomethyl)-3-furanmethanol phosphate kinase
VTRSSLVVVKVGGSLFDWPELPRRMTAYIDARRAAEREERMVLIAGGGPAADLVRVLDQTHGFGDEIAHRLALHALDFTTILLAAFVPGTIAVERVDALRAIWASGSIPVLAPRSVLSEIARSGQDSLPASWDVTSDTIAARIALHLAADRLILLKSAPLPAGTDRQEAARLGLVDPMLPVVARALPHVEYMNLREQSSQPHLLPP